LQLHTSDPEQHPFKPHYTLEVEYFSEDEIEEQLAQLLSAYRAFYLEPDEAEPPRPGRPVRARKSRLAFKAIFKDQLSSAQDETLLLQGEEEDVLDMMLGWIRGMQMPPGGLRREFLDERSDCLSRLCGLAGVPCVKEIR
jgi:hypothetical protein